MACLPCKVRVVVPSFLGEMHHVNVGRYVPRTVVAATNVPQVLKVRYR